MRLTAIYMRVPDGYRAFVEELPGAVSDGGTLDEARANLRAAVEQVLDTHREMAELARGDDAATREPFDAATL